MAQWIESDLEAAAPALLARPASWPQLTRWPHGLAGSGIDPDQHPWLAFWSARGAPQAACADALGLLRAACTRFEARGDGLGALACCMAAVEHLDASGRPGSDARAWGERLHGHWHAWPCHGPAIELKACVAGCAGALERLWHGHELAAHWLESAPGWLPQLRDPCLRARLGTALLTMTNQRGRSALAVPWLSGLPGPLARGLPSHVALPWLGALARHALQRGQAAVAQQAAERALALGAEGGGPSVARSRDPRWLALAVDAALQAEDLPAAQTHLARWQQALATADPTSESPGLPPGLTWPGWRQRASALALARGAADEALALAQSTPTRQPQASERNANDGKEDETSRRARSTDRCDAHLTRGLTLLAAGRPAEAESALQQAVIEARRIDHAQAVFSARMAWSAAAAANSPDAEALAHDGGAAPSRADRRLGAALRDAARDDQASLRGPWSPDLAAGRLARALALGESADYVVGFARGARLPCADPLLAEWPWPLRLRLFGPFEGDTDGRRLVCRGRQAGLLGLLGAFGGSMHRKALMRHLWPTLNGAARERALGRVLAGLRQQRAGEYLVHGEDGRLHLDSGRVWTDTLALDRLLRVGPMSCADGPPSAADLARHAEQVVALARGPLLEGDTSAWAVTARAHWRRRLGQWLCATAARLAAAGDEGIPPAAAHAMAVRLLEAALAADPQADRGYRGLIELHLTGGDLDAARQVWRRARTLLRLGSAHGPSRELTALAKQHGLDGAGSA